MALSAEQLRTLLTLGLSAGAGAGLSSLGFQAATGKKSGWKTKAMGALGGLGIGAAIDPMTRAYLISKLARTKAARPSAPEAIKPAPIIPPAAPAPVEPVKIAPAITAIKPPPALPTAHEQQLADKHGGRFGPWREDAELPPSPQVPTGTASGLPPEKEAIIKDYLDKDVTANIRRALDADRKYSTSSTGLIPGWIDKGLPGAAVLATADKIEGCAGITTSAYNAVKATFRALLSDNLTRLAARRGIVMKVDKLMGMADEAVNRATPWLTAATLVAQASGQALIDPRTGSINPDIVANMADRAEREAAKYGDFWSAFEETAGNVPQAMNVGGHVAIDTELLDHKNNVASAMEAAENAAKNKNDFTKLVPEPSPFGAGFSRTPATAKNRAPVRQDELPWTRTHNGVVSSQISEPEAVGAPWWAKRGLLDVFWTPEIDREKKYQTRDISHADKYSNYMLDQTSGH